MAVPDQDRVGGLAWAQRTKGRLTAAERRRMLGSITLALGSYAAGRIRAATGRVPPGAADLSPPRSRRRTPGLPARAEPHATSSRSR